MKRQLPLAIALAACSFSLPAPAADNIIELQVTPAGHFNPRDGREMKVPSWHIDAAAAAAVIQRFDARRTPPVLDYEHQTLWKEENGQPAPAAGWFRALEWREGQGLFARVELTAKAAQYIADGEYRYFSPVFLFDPVTGDVLDLHMGALTNNPAIDGMPALGVRAAATFGLYLETQETPVNPLLLAVLAALGLAETTTEANAIAALSAHTATLRKELGLDDKADGQALLAACSSLKQQAASATPDPAKYMPLSVVNELKGSIAALTARLEAKEKQDTDTLIADALEDGRLLKPMEDWARGLGKTNRAALTAYLDAAAPLAALSGTQTRGQPPVVDDKSGLSKEELAICSSMGITAEAFKAAKQEA